MSIKMANDSRLKIRARGKGPKSRKGIRDRRRVSAVVKTQ